MLILFTVAVFILGVIVVAADYKTEWSRYLAGILFMGALSGISDEINNFFIPYLKSNFVVSSQNIDTLNRIHGFLTQFCEHIGIFLVAMYCVCYSTLLSKSKKRLVTLLFFTTSTFSFFIHSSFLTTEERIATSTYKHYYFDLSLWGAPMLVAGVIMLFIAYFKEKNPGIIRQRLINLVLTVPLIISGTLNLLILRALGYNTNIILINLLVIMADIVLFSVFVAWKGAFGVRISINRQSVIGSIDTISEGTAIFNHTLKNETGKISVAASNLKNIESQDNPDRASALKNIKVMENSISNLNIMIKRMQDFSGNIKLSDSICNIEEILDKAVENVHLFLKEKNISLIKNYSFKISIQCDESHLVEAITNILKNACEAIDLEGQIRIALYGNRSVLYISIADNGPGIKKEYMSKVLEPFFTTKGGIKNFGFGLSYSYKVLNKHHGDLNIYSKENVGTTVTLSMPGFRIKSYDKNLPVRIK